MGQSGNVGIMERGHHKCARPDFYGFGIIPALPSATPRPHQGFRQSVTSLSSYLVKNPSCPLVVAANLPSVWTHHSSIVTKSIFAVGQSSIHTQLRPTPLLNRWDISMLLLLPMSFNNCVLLPWINASCFVFLLVNLFHKEDSPFLEDPQGLFVFDAGTNMRTIVAIRTYPKKVRHLFRE